MLIFGSQEANELLVDEMVTAVLVNDEEFQDWLVHWDVLKAEVANLETEVRQTENEIAFVQNGNGDEDEAARLARSLKDTKQELADARTRLEHVEAQIANRRKAIKKRNPYAVMEAA